MATKNPPIATFPAKGDDDPLAQWRSLAPLLGMAVLHSKVKGPERNHPNFVWSYINSCIRRNSIDFLVCIVQPNTFWNALFKDGFLTNLVRRCEIFWGGCWLILLPCNSDHQHLHLFCRWYWTHGTTQRTIVKHRHQALEVPVLEGQTAGKFRKSETTKSRAH